MNVSETVIESAEGSVTPFCVEITRVSLVCNCLNFVSVLNLISGSDALVRTTGGSVRSRRPHLRSWNQLRNVETLRSPVI